MATSKKPLAAMKSLAEKGGGDDKNKPLSDEQLKKFADFAGTGDTKEIAKYLMKKGLKGAEQLYTDHPDISSPQGILNAQSDWKASAISKMLMRARSLNLRTPAQVKANQEAILSGLDERYRTAVKHPAFKQIHGNFDDVFNTLLQERYAAESAPAPVATTPAPSSSPLVAALTKR